VAQLERAVGVDPGAEPVGVLAQKDALAAGQLGQRRRLAAREQPADVFLFL
jgi:hypothetical protein